MQKGFIQALRSASTMIRPTQTKFNEKMKPFSTVKAGSPATLEVDLDGTYEVINVHFKNNGAKATEAVMASEIEQVIVSVNGKNQWDISGKDYIAAMKYHGVKFGGGVFPLIFNRDFMRTIQAADFLGLGTSNLSSLTVKIKLASTAVDPELSATCVKSPNSPLGFFVVYETLTVQPAAIGTLDMNKVSTEESGIMAMHLATDAIDELEVKYRSVDIIEQIERDELKIYAENILQQGKTWQAGYTHIDFMPTARFDDALAVDGGTLKQKWGMTATDSFNCVVERVQYFG